MVLGENGGGKERADEAKKKTELAKTGTQGGCLAKTPFFLGYFDGESMFFAFCLFFRSAAFAKSVFLKNKPSLRSFSELRRREGRGGARARRARRARGDSAEGARRRHGGRSETARRARGDGVDGARRDDADGVRRHGADGARRDGADVAQSDGADGTRR